MSPELHGEIFERGVDGANGAEYQMLHAYGLPQGEFMTIYPVPGHDNDIRRGHARVGVRIAGNCTVRRALLGKHSGLAKIVRRFDGGAGRSIKRRWGKNGF